MEAVSLFKIFKWNHFLAHIYVFMNWQNPCRLQQSFLFQYKGVPVWYYQQCKVYAHKRTIWRRLQFTWRKLQRLFQTHGSVSQRIQVFIVNRPTSIQSVWSALIHVPPLAPCYYCMRYWQQRGLMLT